MMPSRASHHTIVALVEDKPGVLNRIASKWRQRGFNIESLAVGHSEIPGLSRMTFTVDGAKHDVDQVTKQLFKVIEVVNITDITADDIVARELALIRVSATPNNRTAIIEIAQVFRANIVDVAHDSMVLEVTGDEDKIEALYELLLPYGVKELMRTGRIAMTRGGAGDHHDDGHRRYRSAGEGKAQVGSLL
ncbi:MAG TPA: acetolactate synthase small subunit [Dehalococcoidia bacterium]|nr:acetolactate synthase small subunit [Dehalococcoidia bacterium]